MKRLLFGFVALLLLTATRSSAEVNSLQLEGNWHEDSKCLTSMDGIVEDPFYIGKPITTPKEDLITGASELIITKYEFGCALREPRVIDNNKITFSASCGEENVHRLIKGTMVFEILSHESMRATFPEPMVSANGPTRTLTLYRCKS
jgi:hypothetical protein